MDQRSENSVSCNKIGLKSARCPPALHGHTNKTWGAVLALVPLGHELRHCCDVLFKMKLLLLIGAFLVFQKPALADITEREFNFFFMGSLSAELKKTCWQLSMSKTSNERLNELLEIHTFEYQNKRRILPESFVEQQWLSDKQYCKSMGIDLGEL